MFIELHMIQNFAPSNLNRDDTNNPKDCEFGGVRRARISSQCIKRSIRQSPIFAETTATEQGYRTRWMTQCLLKSFEAAGKPGDAAKQIAIAFADAYAGVDGKKKERTSVLIYLSKEEIDDIVRTLLDNWETIKDPSEKSAQEAIDKLVKDLVKRTQNRTSAPDIALFGRMLANEPKLNLDASCQVAHAISTHRVNMEMDYFTAVDDLQNEEETGAAMIGVTGFNSACFYRYARLDMNKLIENLDGNTDLARRTVEGFLRASVAAVPTGKQNSFAAQNPPSFLLAVVRKDGMSWSLANAFEKPVFPTREKSLVSGSIAAADGFWGRLTKVYGGASVPVVLTLEEDAPLQALADAQVDTLEEWINAVLDKLPQE
jgi:CRISPR system Cascade subunit CasC